MFTEQMATCTGYWPDWGPSLEDPDWPQPTGPASMFMLNKGSTNCMFSGGNTQYVGVSPHIGGINVSLADGSVRFVSTNVTPTTWWYAMTPSGGETLDSSW